MIKEERGSAGGEGPFRKSVPDRRLVLFRSAVWGGGNFLEGRRRNGNEKDAPLVKFEKASPKG